MANWIEILRGLGGAAQGIGGLIQGHRNREAYQDWLEADNAARKEAFDTSGALQLPEYTPYTSAVEGAYTDPTSGYAKALAEMGNLYGDYSSGQLSEGDKAQLAQNLAITNQQEKAQRDALRTSYAQRGMANSGFEQMAQLQAAQGGADRRASQANENAIKAQQRALELLGNQAQLGQKQQSDIGASKDAANQFNENMKMQQAQYKLNAASGRFGQSNPYKDFINYYGNIAQGGFNTLGDSMSNIK